MFAMPLAMITSAAPNAARNAGEQRSSGTPKWSLPVSIQRRVYGGRAVHLRQRERGRGGVLDRAERQAGVSPIGALRRQLRLLQETRQTFRIGVHNMSPALKGRCHGPTGA